MATNKITLHFKRGLMFCFWMQVFKTVKALGGELNYDWAEGKLLSCCYWKVGGRKWERLA